VKPSSTPVKSSAKPTTIKTSAAPTPTPTKVAKAWEQ
jgi:hypothetical protein